MDIVGLKVVEKLLVLPLDAVDIDLHNVEVLEGLGLWSAGRRGGSSSAGRSCGSVGWSGRSGRCWGWWWWWWWCGTGAAGPDPGGIVFPLG